jgi:hypothetical protein
MASDLHLLPAAPYRYKQVKVPNHTLFFEKVFNLSETSGAVQDFIIAFNIVGLENADMVRNALTCMFVCATPHAWCRATHRSPSTSSSSG